MDKVTIERKARIPRHPVYICLLYTSSGYIKDGHLFLTERIKDLFKTSNGKYIAPQAIEAKLVVDRYICLLYTSRCV